LTPGQRWWLHCGDVYGYYRRVDPVQPYAHPCGRPMEALVTTAFRIQRRHWPVLRGLLQAHGDQVRAFCSHDAHELEACRGVAGG
jgi:hypothetical protein